MKKQEFWKKLKNNSYHCYLITKDKKYYESYTKHRHQLKIAGGKYVLKL